MVEDTQRPIFGIFDDFTNVRGNWFYQRCFPLSLSDESLETSPNRPISTMMNEPFILSQFDRLVASGVVLYDEKQEMVEVGDGKLKVRVA